MVLLLQLARAFNLLTRTLNLATRAFNLLSRGFELVTRNLCFTFPRLVHFDFRHFL